jgi:FKBP-type peptidyl-prolyl cis-trans isomerase
MTSQLRAVINELNDPEDDIGFEESDSYGSQTEENMVWCIVVSCSAGSSVEEVRVRPAPNSLSDINALLGRNIKLEGDQEGIPPAVRTLVHITRHTPCVAKKFSVQKVDEIEGVFVYSVPRESRTGIECLDYNSRASDIAKQPLYGDCVFIRHIVRCSTADETPDGVGDSEPAQGISTTIEVDAAKNFGMKDWLKLPDQIDAPWMAEDSLRSRKDAQIPPELARVSRTMPASSIWPLVYNPKKWQGKTPKTLLQEHIVRRPLLKSSVKIQYVRQSVDHDGVALDPQSEFLTSCCLIWESSPENSLEFIPKHTSSFPTISISEHNAALQAIWYIHDEQRKSSAKDAKEVAAIAEELKVATAKFDIIENVIKEMKSFSIPNTLEEMTKDEQWKNRVQDLLGPTFAGGKLLKVTLRAGKGPSLPAGTLVSNLFYVRKSAGSTDNAPPEEAQRAPKMQVGVDSGMIPFWRFMLPTLQVGEVAVYYCEYRLAWGELGMVPAIPPRQDFFWICYIPFSNDLAKETRLVGIDRGVRSLGPEYQISDFQAIGKAVYEARGSPFIAYDYWEAALSLALTKEKRQVSTTDSTEQLVRLHLNLAAASLSMTSKVQAWLLLPMSTPGSTSNWAMAIHHTTRAAVLLSGISTSIALDTYKQLLSRIYTRQAKAMLEIGEYDSCEEALKQAQAQGCDVRSTKEDLARRRSQAARREKSMFGAAFQ